MIKLTPMYTVLTHKDCRFGHAKAWLINSVYKSDAIRLLQFDSCDFASSNILSASSICQQSSRMSCRSLFKKKRGGGLRMFTARVQ